MAKGPEPRKLFAAALTALKANTSDQTVIKVEVVSTIYVTSVPTSLDEAIGRSLRFAEQRWPLRKGFYNHQVEVVQISQEMIDGCCSHN